MDESVITRIEQSFNLLAPRAQELVDRFYANLFASQPAVRPLFPNDMTAQKQKLLASLKLVVGNLRTPEKLHQPLVELGRRHVDYQTRPEHFPVVRDTLIRVMAEIAGVQWSDQFTSDWKSALDTVASIMLEGFKAGCDARASAAS